MKNKQNKWNRRDKKFHNRKHGMRVSGKSVFVVVGTKVKKAGKVKGGK